MRIAPCGTRVYASDDRGNHIKFAEDVVGSISHNYGQHTKDNQDNIAFWAFVGEVVIQHVTECLASHETQFASDPSDYKDDGYHSTIEEVRRRAKLAINGAKKAIEGKVDISSIPTWNQDNPYVLDERRAKHFKGVVRNAWFLVTNWTDYTGGDFTDHITEALKVDGRWLYSGGKRSF